MTNSNSTSSRLTFPISWPKGCDVTLFFSAPLDLSPCPPGVTVLLRLVSNSLPLLLQLHNSAQRLPHHRCGQRVLTWVEYSGMSFSLWSHSIHPFIHSLTKQIVTGHNPHAKPKECFNVTLRLNKYSHFHHQNDLTRGGHVTCSLQF